MKIRSDFVTNSSSSSFICVFKDEKDCDEQINKISWLSEDYLNAIKHDIKRHIISKEQARDILKDYYTMEGEFNIFWSDNYSAWQSRLKELGLEPFQFAELPEYQELLTEYVTEKMEKAEVELAKYDYITTVEYSDDTDFGSDLEHSIMPSMPFVLEVLDNH